MCPENRNYGNFTTNDVADLCADEEITKKTSVKSVVLRKTEKKASLSLAHELSGLNYLEWYVLR